MGQRPPAQGPVPSRNTDCCREPWERSLRRLLTQPARGQLPKHLKGRLKYASSPNVVLSDHPAGRPCPPRVFKELSLGYLR